MTDETELLRQIHPIFVQAGNVTSQATITEQQGGNSMEAPTMPARISSPGQILSMELEARGWTQSDLAAIMDRPPQALSKIINARKQVTPETALELAEALGTSAEIWLNLESDYRLHQARKKRLEPKGDFPPEQAQ